MEKIMDCLWFDGNAKEAVRFYASVFKGAKITSVLYHDESSAMASGRKKGEVLAITFRLNGREFMALNGGPEFKFSPAISLMVYCKTQKEIDYYWKKLTQGGQEIECGWLTDKFGLTWQIVPSILDKLLASKDKEKSARVMKAMLKMKKLDIAKFKQAAKG
ncbi:MAG: VOC family protein [Candidatus Micrarchaeia archaeon]|jgi:predicted 3-demethylubiquinone-9 3-methyltransferase (glyoxalase superfamily)